MLVQAYGFLNSSLQTALSVVEEGFASLAVY